MKPLTDRQRQVLEILIRTTEDGCQATIPEIGETMQISSTNGVSDHLSALRRKGYIVLGDRKSRSVAILRNPDGTFYATPAASLTVLIQALGCLTYDEALMMALAVARTRRVA